MPPAIMARRWSKPASWNRRCASSAAQPFENYPLVLEFVGNSLGGQGQYAEADAVHRRVLAIRENMYGEAVSRSRTR